ncbi:MAG: hypothetical protein HC933_04375 [Pleurocapsa sp. SU_196_0]|nr:hypothetical protein [Pleurocapsa sp. SU_196_0]
MGFQPTRHALKPHTLKPRLEDSGHKENTMNTPNVNPTSASTAWKNAPRDQRLGYGLLGLAGLVVLGALNDAISGFFVLGALALGFLVAHRRTGLHGFAVPGGILAGIADGNAARGGDAVRGHLPGRLRGWVLARAAPRAETSRLGDLPRVGFRGDCRSGVRHGKRVAGVPHARGGRSVPAASSGNHRWQRRGSQCRGHARADISRLERLQMWRTETAARVALPEAEILRTEQLERLATLKPENVDAMFGVLDAAQIEKHGKALLEVLRGA